MSCIISLWRGEDFPSFTPLTMHSTPCQPMKSRNRPSHLSGSIPTYASHTVSEWLEMINVRRISGTREKLSLMAIVPFGSLDLGSPKVGHRPSDALARCTISVPRRQTTYTIHGWDLVNSTCICSH